MNEKKRYISLFIFVSILILAFSLNTTLRNKVKSLANRVEILDHNAWSVVLGNGSNQHELLPIEVIGLNTYLNTNDIKSIIVSKGVRESEAFYQRLAEGIYPIAIIENSSFKFMCNWELQNEQSNRKVFEQKGYSLINDQR